MEDLLFYDIEVMEYDALVVFMDINKNEVAHFWNNRDRKVQEEPSGFEGIVELINGKTLVGYNNYSYDDNILTLMMNQSTSLVEILKANNDRIVRGEGFSGKKSPLIRSIDTMQQIDVSHPSLKQIEGNMGMSIVESSVDFNIGRPLTDAERDEMLYYCRHDVMATVDVYKLRQKSYFEVKDGLVAMLPEDDREKAMRWNTTTLSANILLSGNEMEAWASHKVPEEYVRNVSGIIFISCNYFIVAIILNDFIFVNCYWIGFCHPISLFFNISDMD